jgi:hypothetical protein
MFKAKFKPNNILYFQDFRYYRGLPTDVLFDVEEESGTHSGWTLRGPGHGGTPYGNGKIFIPANQRMFAIYEAAWKKAEGDRPY